MSVIVNKKKASNKYFKQIIEEKDKWIQELNKIISEQTNEL